MKKSLVVVDGGDRPTEKSVGVLKKLAPLPRLPT
jgi:hypothetical protein